MTEPTADKKGYILVIEDDKFYANIYRTKLTAKGYEVVVVDDGELGLAEARKRKPDLILLDLVLPVKDGFQVLKELREEATFSDTPIVILTVLGQEEDVERAKKMGATDYMVKTDVTIDSVVDKVASYLK